MADDKTKEKEILKEETEPAGWETITDEDEKYIAKLEEKEALEKAENGEDTTTSPDETVEKGPESEADPNPLGMRFHSFWVSFGLPLVIMWAGLDALLALLNLIQGNMGALSNVLIRGAVPFFGFPAMKGMKNFTRKGFIKHSTLIFYSLCVKVVNIIMAFFNRSVAPEYIAQVFQEQAAEFAEKGITEEMLVTDIQTQFTITIGLSIAAVILWLVVFFYYKKRKKYFKYK